MTKEQIKQNAEAYINHMPSLCDALYESVAKEAFIAGAHSRDEEIKQWKESKRKLRSRLMQQIHELRNPWHKASEELPPISEPCDESYDCVLAVLGRHIYIGGKIYLTGFYDHQIRDWHIYGNGYSKMTNLEVIDWMPIPKLKKGE